MADAVPQVVVPAGGRGTRLVGLPRGLPKVLAPVAGRPFLEWQLAALGRQGVSRVHLCLGHLAERVLRDLPALTPAGVEVTYTVEDRPLGVIGAVRHALPALQQTVVLVYGDVYPPAAISALLARHAEAGVAAAMLVARCGDESNIAVSEGMVVRYTKSAEAGVTLADIGLTVLDTAQLAAHTGGGDPATEEQLYGPMAARGALAAVRWPEPSLHIGDPAHLARLESRLAVDPHDPYGAVVS